MIPIARENIIKKTEITIYITLPVFISSFSPSFKDFFKSERLKNIDMLTSEKHNNAVVIILNTKNSPPISIKTDEDTVSN